eukprot:238396_1
MAVDLSAYNEYFVLDMSLGGCTDNDIKKALVGTNGDYGRARFLLTTMGKYNPAQTQPSTHSVQTAPSLPPHPTTPQTEPKAPSLPSIPSWSSPQQINNIGGTSNTVNNDHSHSGHSASLSHSTNATYE